MNLSRSRLFRLIGATVAVGTGICAVPAQGASAAPGGAGTDRAKPTVVLVHGAFADASGWENVIGRLHGEGYRDVIAPANPLRGLASDSAYIASFLKSVRGPIVLVGHSYGGAVITNAATGNKNVKALVYIAAFAPTAKETITSINDRFPATPLATALNPVPYSTGTSSGVDVYIKPDKYRDVFLSDRLPEPDAQVLAATQRPVDAAAFDEPSGKPAWKTIPSWALVAEQDHAISPDAERFMAERAHSRTIEVEAPHAAFLTNPGAVTGLIRDAAQAVG